MKKLFLINSFFIMSITFAGVNDPVSNLAHYNRCYFHLTGHKLLETQSNYNAVKNATMTPVDACMQVLNSADLQTSGNNTGKLITKTQESKYVLSNSLKIHKEWFASQSISASSEDQDADGSHPIYNDYDGALHLTKILHTPGLGFNTLFTSNGETEAIREGGCDPDENRTYGQYVNAGETAYSGSKEPVYLSYVQTGELIGMRSMSLGLDVLDSNCRSTPKKNQTYKMSASGPLNDNYNLHPGVVDIHKPIGNGAFATKPYILHYYGHPARQASDGGLKMPRRWSQAVVTDFLCRELPVLRPEDVSAEIQITNITTDTPPFRTNGTCMQCHVTIDNMAKNIRSTFIQRGPSTYGTNNTILPTIIDFPPNQTAEADPLVNYDKKFYARPPKGKFKMRGYDGVLHNIPTNNISELSAYMATMKDPYVCAASRYFKHFTGIEVMIKDFPIDSGATVEEIAYRNEVVSIGEAFYADKNLKNLIKNIISSNIYKSNSLKLPKE